MEKSQVPLLVVAQGGGYLSSGTHVFQYFNNQYSHIGPNCYTSALLSWTKLNK